MTVPVPPRPTPPRWPRDRGANVERGGHRRLRLTLYVVFAFLALATGAVGWNLSRLLALGDNDPEMIERAGRLSAAMARMQAEAALVASEPSSRRVRAAGLREAGRLAEREADAVDALAGRAAALAGERDAASDEAARAWRAAFAPLRQAGLQLAATPDDATADAVRRLAADLRALAGPAGDAAQRWAAALRDEAEQRASRVRRDARRSGGLLLVLLGLLSIAIVEPTARSVARYLRRLAEQSTEVQMLALVAEHTTAAVLITDRDDRIQWVNDAFTRICGWPLSEVAGRRPPEILAHPHADTTVSESVQLALQTGQGVRKEWLRRARDGRDVWLDIDLRPLRDESGELTGFVRVATDVTARVQQQAKLLALWSALPAGVVVVSPDGLIVDANRAAERLLGLSLEEMQGRAAVEQGWQALREDMTPYPPDEMPAMRTLRTHQPLFNETLGVRTADGQLRWLLVNTEPQIGVGGEINGVISCFTDITERRVLQDQLSEHARTDALTRLPNRSVVMERLVRAVEHARRHPGYGFAVLFMDFDRFKQVNDTLGHGAGDDLLRQIAARLLRALRPGDAVARLDGRPHVAARLGGDEFVVVLDGVHDADTVSVITDRVLSALAEPYVIGSVPVHSSASIGVVLSGDSLACKSRDNGDAGADAGGPAGTTAYDAAEQVLRNADTAMYEAKRAGRGRWVLFDESMQERVVRSLAMESDLRRALRDDELFVMYQPVVELSARRLVGVEALVRWRHPQRGLVPPMEFIGVAEECGLIDAVGSVVLRQSCTQFVAWQRDLGALAPAQLAVNLSRAQLKRSGLVDDLRALLEHTEMPPERLQLEVTESLAAQDEQIQTALRELKALGIRLALDDFGTGYSSLACLHLMPVDTVKVDRSFVRHAETVEYHRVLIEATIRVARTLGMSTVAEGIETEGQAALMRELDCDRGQGYLFARPLEPDDLETWVRRREALALAA